jgi:predicted RecB family nuclease
MCQRRVWLDHYEETPTDLPPIGVIQQGIEHEARLLQATAPHVVTIPVNSWQQGVETTQTLLRQTRVEVIDGAYLEIPYQDAIIRGRLDRLQKLQHRYQVIEIKNHTRLQPTDLIQMDLYLWMLDQISDRSVAGEFWLGRNGTILQRVSHEYDEQRLMTALHQVLVLLGQREAPDVLLKQHCKLCPWHDPCTETASNQLHLTLLTGMRKDTLQDFQRQGITSLQQIVMMLPADLQKIKGIKSNALALHTQARAWVAGHPVWYRPLPTICLQGGWMFDIETDPYTGVVWCIGWCDDTGKSEIALVAPHISQPTPFTLLTGETITLVPDADRAWETFALGVIGDNRPIFHWTNFDATMLRKTAPEVVRDWVGHRLYDLHQIVNQTVKFPVKSTSIKAIAGYLQFRYAVYEAWDAAFNDYQLWLSRDDLTAITRACAYQRDDVLALKVVWQWLTESQSDPTHLT